MPLFLIMLVLGGCYALSIAPDLTWAHFSADGGDLISAAATGGVPHPGGYPLYLILARGFQFLPLGGIAFRTNLLSAVCVLLTALVLDRYLRAYSLGQASTFLAALAYGLAPFVWGQALVTEVYALHGLLLMLCLVVLSLEQAKVSEWFRGFVFGLAAANHLTSLMLLPLLALGSDGPWFASRNMMMKRGLGVLCGLSLYLSLPLRAYFAPPINWGNASTLNGFIWLISGQLYRQYPFSLPLPDLIQHLRAFAGLLLRQYTWLGALLGVYGLISPLPPRVLIPTGWMAATFLLFAVSYGSADAQVYLLPVWLAFAIWLGFGLDGFLTLLPGQRKQQAAVAGALFAVLMVRAYFTFPKVDLSQNVKAHEFISNAERVIPKNALVFVIGDEQIFSLWYAQFVLGLRPDMAIIAEGLLPYPWYRQNLEDTYKNLEIPGGETLRSSDLDAANSDRPICHISPNEPIVCSHVR